MPLELQIIRNDDSVKLKWDYFALSCCFTAAVKEALPDTPVNDAIKTHADLKDGQWVNWSMMPIYAMGGFPLLDEGRQELKNRHIFRNPTDDGSVVELELMPGDILTARRVK